MSPKATEVDAGSRFFTTALIELVGERDYDTISLDDLVERSGATSEEFKRHFADLDECFFIAWWNITVAFLNRLLEAFQREGEWLPGIRAAVWEICQFLQEDEPRSRTMATAAPFAGFAGEEVLAHRDRELEFLVEFVDQGRNAPSGDPNIPREIAEIVVGALMERFESALADRALATLPGCIPELMYLIALPYLGREAALEELRRGPADIAAYERGELLPFSRDASLASS